MGTLVFQFSTCQPESWRARNFPILFDASSWIRRLTHSPFSHVDLVMPGGDALLGASDSPDAPFISGNPRGVAIRPHDYQRFGVRHRAYIKTPVADLATQLMFEELGKPFDHGAVSMRHFLSDGFATRDWRDPGQWFCAELCTKKCDEAGLWSYPLVITKDSVTPSDFALLLNPLMDVARFCQPYED